MTAHEMTHEAAVAELESVALGASSRDVSDAVAAHVASCESCSSELDRYGEAIAELAALAPTQMLNRGRSAGIRSRLLARASADAESASRRKRSEAMRRSAPPEGVPARMAAVTVEPVPQRGVAAWWALAATIAFVVSSALLARAWVSRDSLRDQLAARDEQYAARTDSLEQALEQHERALQVMSAPSVRVVNLTSWSTLREPPARMYWDPRTNRWVMFSRAMRQPAPGKVFQVWLLRMDEKRVSAGTFRPAEDGSAMLEVTYQLPREMLRGVAVTEEPMPGMDQPTGPIILAGSPR